MRPPSHAYRPIKAPRGELARERCRFCGLQRRTVGVLEPGWNTLAPGLPVGAKRFPILRTLILYRPKGGADWSTFFFSCLGPEASPTGVRT